MIHYPKRTIAFAVCLAILSGYVDAIGFLGLGGFFVSFMSGNTTRLGIGVGTSNTGQVEAAIGLIALFVVGVICGSIVGKRWGDQRRRAVLAFVAICLTLGSTFYQAHILSAGAAFQVIAMGAMNATFERDGEVSVGVTYTTGSLVKAGQRIALALQGGPKWTWLPYVSLWGGLAVGAAFGVRVFNFVGTTALWGSVAWAGLMILLAERVP